jgi:CzcA family heavy metal efflux pump
MLNKLIALSLRHRPLVLALSLLLLVFGAQTARQLPVEVLPDMTKPTVTVLTEAPGFAPEEVEALVTQPIEAAVQGVGGLDRLRSSSDVSLSLVTAEFAWGTDIYRARQLVQERLQAVLAGLPAGVRPGLTPVSSLMGEILLVGLRSKEMPARELRILADWTVARRLQSIAGVAEVLVIGGGVKQVHILPDPVRLAGLGVALSELETAASHAAGNTSGGYLTTRTQEIMVRNLGMTTDLEDIADTVIKRLGDRPVLIRDVARVEYGVQPMRGDASVNGDPGVILSVDKAPGFDTLRITEAVEAALAELKPALPPGVELELLFRQGDFISHAIGNLKEAIRDGAFMVALVLFLFLLNFRTTLITLTAMPLSFFTALLVFKAWGVSVNSMTLGGLAVAIGMVVDDAIVDVENVFRRLRENARLPVPKPGLKVIAAASGEVRNSILYATVLILLVFLPLLSLEGLEGRLFTPIAVATMVSMAASFVVSLTVIPVLCSLLLRPGHPKPGANGSADPGGDGALVRGLKWAVEHTFLRAAFDAPFAVLGITGALFAGALMLYPGMGKDFLPAFNEGSATISLASPPGTSLEQSNAIGQAAVRLLLAIPEVKSVGRRAGRAERDDHVMPVSVNEFDVEFNAGGRSRQEVFGEIRARFAGLPGTFTNVGQPIAHRLAHMLSGVPAKVAVKIFGPDLEVLREKGAEVERIARGIPGLADVFVEKQVPIPQLRIEVDRARAKAWGVQPGAVNAQLATLLGGKVLAQLREGQRTMDLLLRLPPEWRDAPGKLGELLVETAQGQRIPLRLVADVREAAGPGVIHRENTQRRMVIGANTSQRDLEGLVSRLQNEVRERVSLPVGYSVRFEGEFKSRKEAARRIALVSGLVVVVMALLLSGYFRSVSLAAQVLLNIPLALMGGLALTRVLVDNVSIATLVGMIAVAGVAARNSIMLLSHYLHLMRHEGEGFTRAMITRGTLERIVPVLMTALSAGIALVPLLFAAHEPGKEILHPVAVVMVGGLISSTLLDLAVTPAVFWLFGRRAAERSLAR